MRRLPDFSEFSDTFLTLAAIAPLLDGPTRITGIAHTRKQETDRVSGMAPELRRLGQEVAETEDSLEIRPRPLREGVTVETHGDHRFAMSFAVLGCHDLRGTARARGSPSRDPACCAKTFPGFLICSTGPRKILAPDLPDEPQALHHRRHRRRRRLRQVVDGARAERALQPAAQRHGILLPRRDGRDAAPRGPAADLAAVEAALADLRLGTRIEGRSARIEISGRLPGDEIRSREVNDAVSHFAAIPELRVLLAYQRGQAEAARKEGFAGLVMEGRDIGSVIFPDADFRFFLHADPGRARAQAGETGPAGPVAERDRLDSSRKTAPLSQPGGAVSIDTTL
jgi:3-phosphoshikimate 1-carboxyvinyltransferase